MSAGDRDSDVFEHDVGGFTLIELMIAIAILAVLVTVGLPAYSNYQERTRVYHASVDITALNSLIRAYMVDNRGPPDDLSAVGSAGKLDPWGTPYAYLNLHDKGATGKARKNKKLTPINSDFDLYSVGRDKGSVPPLTAKISHDDVVMANDGRFVGLASTYEP